MHENISAVCIYLNVGISCGDGYIYTLELHACKDRNIRVFINLNSFRGLIYIEEEASASNSIYIQFAQLSGISVNRVRLLLFYYFQTFRVVCLILC